VVGARRYVAQALVSEARWALLAVRGQPTILDIHTHCHELETGMLLDFRGAVLVHLPTPGNFLAGPWPTRIMELDSGH